MVAASGLRIVFFGTPQFAVPTLESLLASRHAVVGVVTQPDRPRGRGQKTTDAPVKARARAAGVPMFQPASFKDPAFMAGYDALRADIGVVAAYGKILSDAVLAVPARGLINVHASLLPRYRGAAPIHRAVMAGDAETGVTIMRVVKALDAGPTLATVRRRIGTDETSDSVEHDLARLGARLLVETVDRMADGPVAEVPQNDEDATYAKRLAKEDGIVDWSRSAMDIHNQIRGLYPWPHAFSFLNGERVILLRSLVAAGGAQGEPGAVVSTEGHALVVATGEGTLSLTEVQREGKRPMSARDFLAGHVVRAGDLFRRQP